MTRSVIVYHSLYVLICAVCLYAAFSFSVICAVRYLGWMNDLIVGISDMYDLDGIYSLDCLDLPHGFEYAACGIESAELDAEIDFGVAYSNFDRM